MQASQSGTNILFNGESFDVRIGQQYLRARWYNSGTGRFNRLDPFFGNHEEPQSFHKYIFAHSDPINGSDPTGNETLAGQMSASSMSAGISAVQQFAIYAARQAVRTTLETGFEYMITQQIYSWFMPGETDDTDWGRAWTTNYISNLVTGKFGDTLRVQAMLLDMFIQSVSDYAAGQFSWLSLATRALSLGVSAGLGKAASKLLASESIKNVGEIAQRQLARAGQRLDEIAEVAAIKWLTGLTGNVVNSHFLGKHGPLVGLDDLYNRAVHGIDPITKLVKFDPDTLNVLGKVDSTRFYNHVDMKEAIEKAQRVFDVRRQGGITDRAVRIDMLRDIGEGYAKDTGVYRSGLTQVVVYFDNYGQVITAFPSYTFRP